MSTSMNRRTFFRGTTLGTAGLYLSPFLRDLQAVEGSTKPSRVLFFVQGNGLYPDEIQPKGIERERNPDKLEDRSLDGAELANSLEPLAPWKKRMTLINGLSGRIARGSHNMGFAALGCWPMKKGPFGETIDAAMARNLPGVFPHVGVGISEKYGALGYNITSKSRGKALPTIMNPVLARQEFFAARADGSAKKSFDVDTELFSFMSDDIKRLQKQLNNEEKEKLERYLEAFDSMTLRQEKLVKMGPRIAKATPQIEPKLGAPMQFKNANPGPTGAFARLDAQFDIAAGTFIAGLSNVATVSACAGPDRIGISCHSSEIGKGNGMVNAHGIGHGGSAAGLSSSECHALIRRRCLEGLARFLKTLESIPEGDGSMLDNTLVVYLSDSAEGHHPVCHEWPFVLIGDLGGRLKLGNRYLRYPWYGKTGHRTINSLYLSLLHSVGERKESFGLKDSAILDLNQDGPLTEIMA